MKSPSPSLIIPRIETQPIVKRERLPIDSDVETDTSKDTATDRSELNGGGQQQQQTAETSLIIDPGIVEGPPEVKTPVVDTSLRLTTTNAPTVSKRKRIWTTIESINMKDGNENKKIKTDDENEKATDHDSDQNEVEIIAIERRPQQTNPMQWTNREIYEFVERVEDAELAAKFRVQDIDGRALDYLSVEVLMGVFGISLGRAARVKAAFDKLKKCWSI